MADDCLFSRPSRKIINHVYLFVLWTDSVQPTFTPDLDVRDTMITNEQLRNLGVRFGIHFWWAVFGAFLIFLIILLRFFPIRITSDWSLNPILYGIVTLIFFVLSGYFILYRLKHYIIILFLIVCMILSGSQVLISHSEINTCWVEDTRWTKLFYCKNRESYQQIGNLPIAMKGYCYYCIWYD